MKEGTAYPSTSYSEIVESPEIAPPFLSGKTAVEPELKSDFLDADHWNELARRYLSSYDLPGWGVRCEPESMALWLDRLDMSERQYKQVTNTSLADFCELNPTWPLRAFVGLALEMKHENIN